MNREDIEEAIYERTQEFVPQCVYEAILELIALEREACAKLCYEETNKHPIGLVTWWATTHCAQAIEARGKA